MDLAAHFRVIAQNWLRILLISIGIAALVFAWSTVQTKKYEAETVLVVTPGGTTTGGETLADASAFLAQTYAKYADTPAVMRETIRSSGLDLTIQEARDRISASQAGELGFVELTATGPSKAEAERLARFASASLITTIQSQQTQKKFADLSPIQRDRQLLQEQFGFVDGYAGIGDALTVNGGHPCNILLSPIDEMALDHRAEDAHATVRDSIADGRHHVLLPGVVLFAIAV